jgi:hypothetical protein
VPDPKTLDERDEGIYGGGQPLFDTWPGGIVVIRFARWREFGYCAARLGWSWRYTRKLLYALEQAVAMTKHST